MRRINDELQLTETEIRCMYKYLFGGDIPAGHDLEEAARACVFYVGVEFVEETLKLCKGGVK